MKKYLENLKWALLLTTLMALPVYAEPLYEQEDKQKHFVASAFISSIATKVALENGATKLEAQLYGVGASLLVGLAKEAYDEYSYGGADIEDGYADLFGAVVGSTLVIGYSWEF